MYDLEEERAVAWFKSRKADSVLVQAPDGIKPYLDTLVEALEESGVRVIVSSSHAWGGCDVALSEARSLGLRHIIHVGHHGPVRFRIPRDLDVLFIPAYVSTPYDPARETAKLLGDIGASKVGVVTVVQHANFLKKFVDELRGEGFNAFICRGGNLPEGLVIGCDYSNPLSYGEVEAYVVLAGGVFHALGLSLLTEKPVIAADPYTGKAKLVYELKKKVVTGRLNAVSKAIDAKRFTVIVSTKPGQKSAVTVENVVKMLKKAGRKVRLVSVDDVTWEKLYNLNPPDAYVNTACPRLAIDDPEIFPAPVINPGELRHVLSGYVGDYSTKDALYPLTFKK